MSLGDNQAINEVKNYAGGEQAYDSLVQWAGQNLEQNSINAFDSIVGTGSIDAIKIAVKKYAAEVKDRTFPSSEHVYHMPPRIVSNIGKDK